MLPAFSNSFLIFTLCCDFLSLVGIYHVDIKMFPIEVKERFSHNYISTWLLRALNNTINQTVEVRFKARNRRTVLVFGTLCSVTFQENTISPCDQVAERAVMYCIVMHWCVGCVEFLNNPTCVGDTVYWWCLRASHVVPRWGFCQVTGIYH